MPTMDGRLSARTANANEYLLSNCGLLSGRMAAVAARLRGGPVLPAYDVFCWSEDAGRKFARTRCRSVCVCVVCGRLSA